MLWMETDTKIKQIELLIPVLLIIFQLRSDCDVICRHARTIHVILITHLYIEEAGET